MDSGIIIVMKEMEAMNFVDGLYGQFLEKHGYQPTLDTKRAILAGFVAGLSLAIDAVNSGESVAGAIGAVLADCHAFEATECGG